MSDPFQPWNHEAVLRAFRALTEIELRVVPNEVAKQAVMVAENFSLRDLELVVLWTKKMIARGQGGFSNASLQWRVLMGRIGCGEDLMAFQDRLGTATAEMARGWKPPFRLSAPVQAARKADAPPVNAAPQPVDAATQARMAAEAKRQQQELFAKLNGGQR